MAQYTTAAAGWTPIAHVDGATDIVSNSYHSLRTTAALNMARVLEVFIGGEQATTTVNRMTVRRASADGATITDIAPAALRPGAVASTAKGSVSATTGPDIASTGHLLNLAFNAFGGVIRWVAAPGEELWIMTNTAPDKEIILDSISGAGVVSDHMIFEEM